MARENEEQTLRRFEKRKKRYRQRRAVFFTVLLLIIVVAGSIYLLRLYNRTYQNYEITDRTSNTGENITGYLEYGGAVVRYSKDGAVAIDKNGNQLWNGSYQMQDPIADVSDKFVVVADRGSDLIHIFGEKGAVGSFSTHFEITKVDIASQGVVAAMMEDGDVSYIQLFDTKGTVLTERIMHASKDGYPMDIALSKDGKKLVVVFVSVNKGKITNTIAFYNFSEVGQNFTDNFTGGFIYEDIVVPRVTFLNNDTVCVYKENGFILYSVPETPEFVTEETFESRIKSILFNNKYTGLVLEGEESDESKLVLYDLKGDKIMDRKLELDYDAIFISDEEIIMYDNLTCIILKTNGKKKFEYTFASNISAFLPINHLDRYFMINAEEITEIQLLE